MSGGALMATCWSSAGDAASDRKDLRSPLPLRRRVEAAAAAGFTGFGLLSDDLPSAVAEYGLPGIRTMLADNGIVQLELESIPYWWDDGAHRAESDRVRHALLAAAEVLRPRHLKVTPDGENGPWDRAHWAAKFAELAAQADDVGARLGIEFFPWANVSSLHEGLRLVEDAGHEAGGVIIDAWHVARAGTPTADLVGMVAALRTAGWAGPWGVEILSEEHRALPVEAALARAAESARRVLAEPA